MPAPVSTMTFIGPPRAQAIRRSHQAPRACDPCRFRRTTDVGRFPTVRVAVRAPPRGTTGTAPRREVHDPAPLPTTAAIASSIMSNLGSPPAAEHTPSPPDHPSAIVPLWAIVLVIALILAGGGLAARTLLADGGEKKGPTYPKAWDSRI